MTSQVNHPEVIAGQTPFSVLFGEPVEQKGSTCGVMTMRGSNLTESVYARLDCKCWRCKKCGPKKAGRYKHAIRNEAERHGLNRFVTLTLDPKNLEPGVDPVRHLRKAFDALRHEWKRKFGQPIKYICVLEFHKNGLPHLHLVVDRYMPFKWVSLTWQKCGGGQHVHLKGNIKLNAVSRYLAKYLTKDLLLDAPVGARRVTVSRGIILNPKSAKPSTHKWERLKINIRDAFRRLQSVARDVEVDTENALKSFIGPPVRFVLETVCTGPVARSEFSPQLTMRVADLGTVLTAVAAV